MFKGRDKQGGHLDGYFLATEDAPIQMPVCGVLKPKKLESLLTCDGVTPSLFSWVVLFSCLSLFKFLRFHTHRKRENGVHFGGRQVNSRHPGKKKSKSKMF